MSVTTPPQGSGPAQQSGPAKTPPPQAQRTADAPARRPRAKRRGEGVGFGPLPVANIVVLELGIAIGLLLLTLNRDLLWIGVAVAALGLVLAFTRWGGHWLTQWVGLTAGYAMRGHNKVATPAGHVSPPDEESGERTTSGPDDARVALLRLAVPDLLVAHGTDHDRTPVGLAYNDGGWTAVLLVDPVPPLVYQIGKAPNMPLSVLAPCLEDRGVQLDAIQVIWHSYPGSAALPADSPALASYLEALGPLPTAARRTTWVAVRLDPRRCAQAVSERGGGVEGAHRALIGALSRVRNALEGARIRSRPLSPDELLAAGIKSSELSGVAGSDHQVALNERWDGVTAGGIGHSSYAITGWPTKGSLNELTSVRALSSTLVMSISPGEDEQIGLRGVARVSARTPGELTEAEGQLQSVTDKVGMDLTSLRGRQLDGLIATLPFGGTA